MPHRLLTTVVLTALVVGTGCATGATADQLRDRAAFDFDCSQQHLTLHEIDDQTIGVDGCGKRATYVEVCRACHNGYQGCDCSWILNTDSEELDPREAVD